MKKVKQSDIYAISAYTIDNKPTEVKALITKYGIALPANASQDDIDKAFIALNKKSKTFRKDFSALAATSISSDNNFMHWLYFAGMENTSLDSVFNGADGFRDFAGQGKTSLNSVFNGADGFRDFVSQGKDSLESVFNGFAGQEKTSLDSVFNGADGVTGTGLKATPLINSDGTLKTGSSTTSTARTTKPRSGKLGEAFDSDTIKNIINTGLNIWATKSGTTADINQGRTDYTTNPNSSAPAPSKGIGTTGIVLLVIGGLAAIGVLVYTMNKKK